KSGAIAGAALLHEFMRRFSISRRLARAHTEGMGTFRITGLDPAGFAHLYGLSDAALAEYGARRYLVDTNPGFPDRIEMRDVEIGQCALLVNYTHLDVASPYRSSHAVFIREYATSAYDA